MFGSHPQVQHDLRDEVRGKLQGRSPGPQDLAALSLRRAVFAETLRLSPPAWGQPHEAIQADEVLGRAILLFSPLFG
jgi:cytochrome P450